MSVIEQQVVDEVHSAFEHYNANHADTVLFIARHLADGSELASAELVDFDERGITVEVIDGEGSRSIRVPFDGEVTNSGDVQVQLFALLGAARAADPEGEPTSIEREMAEHGQIPTRVVEVTKVGDIAPNLREITIGGIRGHVPLGPDDFFLVILPKPGLEHQLDVPDLSFSYFQALPEEEAPGWAYYTCRNWHAATGEMDLWFVLHEHDGAVSGWARRAQVGDRVALWGPRAGFEPPEGTTSYLVVADETGLGAVAGILDAADGGIPVTVVAASDDGRPVLDLPARPKDTIHWVSRDGCRHGEGTHLLDAVATLDLDIAGLYAYGAAESREITAVRKHLRYERGIPAEQVQMVGYWRRKS